MSCNELTGDVSQVWSSVCGSRTKEEEGRTGPTSPGSSEDGFQ